MILKLGGGFKFQAFFYVHPYLGGEITFLTNIFEYACVCLKFKVTFYFYQGKSPLPYYVEYCFFAKDLKQN